jgi:DNA-binding NtrC family response regulator
MESMRTLFLVMRRDAARRALAEILAGEGFEVLAAGDASEAMRVWQSVDRRIEALIGDERLGSTGGVELAWLLRERDPDLQIILTAGEAEWAPARERRGKPLQLAALLWQLDHPAGASAITG